MNKAEIASLIEQKTKPLAEEIHKLKRVKPVQLFNAFNWDIEKIERAMIVKLLETQDNNISDVAQIMGTTFQSIDRRIEKYKIKIKRKFK